MAGTPGAPSPVGGKAEIRHQRKTGSSWEQRQKLKDNAPMLQMSFLEVIYTLEPLIQPDFQCSVTGE